MSSKRLCNGSSSLIRMTIEGVVVNPKLDDSLFMAPNAK